MVFGGMMGGDDLNVWKYKLSRCRVAQVNLTAGACGYLCSNKPYERANPIRAVQSS